MEVKRRRRKGDGLSDAAVVGIAINGLGSAEVLKIEEINVDTAYQRSLRHDLVNKIASEYDIVKAGPILVSEREDDTLWAVDGQHRMAGALQAGETEIFAHVVRGLDQETEANLRLARNERRSDSTFEKFRTRMVMGDKKVHRMVEVAHEYGVELNLEPNAQSGINALGTAEFVYDVDGTGVQLARVIKFITEAFQDETGEFSASMLKAVLWFIDRHIDSREVNWKEATERFGTFGIDDIRRKAVSHKAANGGSLWVNYYRALVEIWNFRRTEANKIHWKISGSAKQLGGDNTKPGTTTNTR